MTELEQKIAATLLDQIEKSLTSGSVDTDLSIKNYREFLLAIAARQQIDLIKMQRDAQKLALEVQQRKEQDAAKGVAKTKDAA